MGRSAKDVHVIIHDDPCDRPALVRATEPQHPNDQIALDLAQRGLVPM